MLIEAYDVFKADYASIRLNPYSTGRCSLSGRYPFDYDLLPKVLILILLEDAH